MSLPDKLAFVDIETTGGRAIHDRIIEIGIVRVENNEIVSTYQSLMDPGTYVSPFIENLTGISQKDLESAPSFFEVKDDILAQLEGAVFVAHNVRFDYGFVRHEMKRFNTAFASKHFCTVKLSRSLFPEHRLHNLDALIERFGFTCENRHRALDDAKILWEFYQRIQKQFDPEVVAIALSEALKRPSRPLNISEETLNSLPESPGVYIFHGSDDVPLYVGKSINIRERVLSHFSSDTDSTKERELSEQIYNIETIVTAGELSALFLESQLVKELQPLYNRKLRQQRKLFVLVKNTLDSGYESIELQEMETITVDDLPRIMALVRSKKQSETLLRDIAKEHSLCPKLLGIEHTTGSCFSHRLGWCKGACVDQETPLLYNLRMINAFSKYKIQKWPFGGPIIISEYNEADEKQKSFVIDQWCYIGSCEGENTCEIQQEYIFDLDCYKILLQFLRYPKNYKKIKPLNPQSQFVISS
jgi:DNA polymerase-3 subunit epsilon